MFQISGHLIEIHYEGNHMRKLVLTVTQKVRYNYGLKFVNYRPLLSALSLLFLGNFEIVHRSPDIFYFTQQSTAVSLFQIINTTAPKLNSALKLNTLRVLWSSGCHPGGEIQFKLPLKVKRCIYCTLLLQSELKDLIHCRLTTKFIFKNVSYS